jgi:hypothetical protein
MLTHAGGVQAVVRACPEITALTDRGYLRFSQEDLDSILGTCKNLQRLCITSESGADLLSFARLESFPCARSLTSIEINPKLTPRSVEVICCCCPAIEELAVRGVGPADVRAMASLMRLRVLEVGHDPEQGPELAEVFTALGNAEGATPLTRLMLWFAKFDATGLFSSRRCSALRELKLIRCSTFTEQAMRALATNVRDSLESLMI